MDVDGLFPELPPLVHRWEVTFTLARPAWDGVPNAPREAGVTAMYTADVAQAVTVVTADGEDDAVAAARRLCSGLGWVTAEAAAKTRPVAARNLVTGAVECP